jgi:hypothetical protein
MSLNRYAKRRDANEPEIIAALRGVGAKVWRLDTPLDLLVFFGNRFYLLEVKDPSKRFTIKDSQSDFLVTCGDGAPAAIVLTVADALKAIGATSEVSP